jgi:phenylacetate-CoA ligase
MSFAERLYKKMPLIAQHGMVSAYGAYWYWLRFGPGYEAACQKFAQRTAYDISQWQTWQQQRCQQLLTTAARYVPYYQQTWTKQEKEAAQAGHLYEMPLLEKEAVRENPLLFLRQDQRPRYRITFHTSGSTGTPVATIWTVPEVRASMAVREIRSAKWAGVSFKIPRATFSGRIVEPDPNSSGPFYRFNLVEQQVYLSPFHLRSDTAVAYIHALKKHKIEWLTGYAVSNYLLANFILENNIPSLKLKALITTSEKVTPEMRKVMEVAYGCRVYEEYSTVENHLFASECEYGRLHLSPDVGIVEILRQDGSPCLPHEVGEVVVTGLLRRYQPFIRFRLGDLAAWDDQPCPCGRQMPIIKEVVGRLEDIVIGPDGRQMVRFHGIFIDQPHVQEGQIIQEALDRIRVKVVPNGRFDQSDVQSIVTRVQQRLGPQVEVVVESVNIIPRTPNGKFQAVISQILRPDKEVVQNGSQPIS